MSVHYDSLAINRNIILDLPFREGIGALYTHDISKPHHQLTMVSAPAWTILASYTPWLILAWYQHLSWYRHSRLSSQMLNCR